MKSSPAYIEVTHHLAMRTRLALEREDAIRSAELVDTIKVLGICWICGKTLTDRTLIATPRVCTKRNCRRKFLAMRPEKPGQLVENGQK